MMGGGNGARGTAFAGAAHQAHYGRVARHVHWLVFGLAVIVVTLGWAAVGAPPNSPARSSLLLLHRSIGLTILALMLFRTLWRARHPPPPLPPSLARLEAGLTRLTHLGLYVGFIAMPVSGYLNAAAAGHAVSFFGLAAIPPFAPANGRLSQWAIAAHLLGQYLVYALVALHVAGAAYHALIRRDGVFERMLPRRGAAPLAPNPEPRRRG
jgi:cytochrome b561